MLDEVAAALLPAAAAALEATLAIRFAGVTRLRISHDARVLARCDAVAVIAAGRVAELGAPATLAADASSLFAQLCAHASA